VCRRVRDNILEAERSRREEDKAGAFVFEAREECVPQIRVKRPQRLWAAAYGGRSRAVVVVGDKP
jgi:hypothetical protein